MIRSFMKRSAVLALALLMLVSAFSGCAIKKDYVRLSFAYDVLGGGTVNQSLIDSYLRYNYEKAVAEKDGLVRNAYFAKEVSASSFCGYSILKENEVKVNIDYACYGEDGTEITSENGYVYELGSELWGEEFDTAVHKINVGTTEDVFVSFPAEYGADGNGNPSFAGKSLKFTVKLNYIEKSPAISLGTQFAFNRLEQSSGTVGGSITSGTVTGGNVVSGSVAENGGASFEGSYIISGDDYVYVTGGNGGAVSSGNGYFYVTDGESFDFSGTGVSGIYHSGLLTFGSSITSGALKLGTVLNPTGGDNCTLHRIYPADESVFAENGDKVNISYDGTVDGENKNGLNADKTDLTLGSGTYIDGFEQALVGAYAGQTLDAQVTFPEDYTEEFAGKTALFTITVHRVEKLGLPEYDDENVKKYLNYETVAEYEAEYGNAVLESLLWNHLLNSIDFEVSFNSMRADAEKFLGERHAAYAEQYGMTRDQYADEVLFKLISAKNSAIYSEFLISGDRTVSATVKDGKVSDHAVMEPIQNTEYKGEADKFTSYIGYIAMAQCVDIIVFDALAERYPELDVTDEEFNAMATEYLGGTLQMSDDEIAEYLNGDGRDHARATVTYQRVIGIMKDKYTIKD